MFGAAAAKIECEATLGDFPAQEFVAWMQFVEVWREFTLRNKLNKKFEPLLLIGRRDDRVGALDTLAVVIHAEGGVLAGFEGKWTAGIDLDQPQVFGEVAAFHN